MIKQTIGSLYNESQPEHDNEKVFHHARQLLLNDELFLNSTLCCCYLVKIKMESFSKFLFIKKSYNECVAGVLIQKLRLMSARVLGHFKTTPKRTMNLYKP